MAPFKRSTKKERLVNYNTAAKVVRSPSYQAYRRQMIPASQIAGAPDLQALKIPVSSQIGPKEPSKITKPAPRPASKPTKTLVAAVTKRIPLQEIPNLHTPSAVDDKDRPKKFYGLKENSLFWDRGFNEQKPLPTYTGATTRVWKEAKGSYAFSPNVDIGFSQRAAQFRYFDVSK